MRLVVQQCLDILDTGFKSTDDEKEGFVERFEIDIKRYTQDHIKKLFQDINTNLLRRFNKEFKEEENGKIRDWVKVEEP